MHWQFRCGSWPIYGRSSACIASSLPSPHHTANTRTLPLTIIRFIHTFQCWPQSSSPCNIQDEPSDDVHHIRVPHPPWFSFNGNIHPLHQQSYAIGDKFYFEETIEPYIFLGMMTKCIQKFNGSFKIEYEVVSATTLLELQWSKEEQWNYVGV